MAQMACDRVQVSRFTGRKVGERVLSEATGIDPVRSSAARQSTVSESTVSKRIWNRHAVKQGTTHQSADN